MKGQSESIRIHIIPNYGLAYMNIEFIDKQYRENYLFLGFTY